MIRGKATWAGGHAGRTLGAAGTAGSWGKAGGLQGHLCPVQDSREDEYDPSEGAESVVDGEARTEEQRSELVPAPGGRVEQAV